MREQFTAEASAAQSRRACTRCLFYEGMQRWLNPHHVPARLSEVVVDDTGTCNVCLAYELEHDDALLDLALISIRERARAGGVVVALSGGKDSVAALWRARHELVVEGSAQSTSGRVIACLYDNGFIPTNVVERARDLCARVDVELAALPADRAFASVVDDTRADGPSPCEACAGNVRDRLLALCDDREVSVIVTGTNYWAAWGSGGPSPVATWTTPSGRRVQVAHLPYLLRQTRADTLAIVAAAGVDVVMMPGVSSNCRVPSIVQDRVAGALGHVPELEDLSLEVIVGHITRDEALAELEEKAPAHRALLTIGASAGSPGPRPRRP